MGHEDTGILKKYCGAITYEGKSCHNRAGEGTPHLGTGFCHFHEFPEGKFIHNSRKLGYTFNCRSQYEKYALDKLEDDPNVLKYEYETLSVPFVFGRGRYTYIPDLLVTYSDGKRVIIEIKGNFDMQGGPDATNYAKFQAVDNFAKENGWNFIIWVYSQKDGWSFKRFSDIPHQETSKINRAGPGQRVIIRKRAGSTTRVVSVCVKCNSAQRDS